MLRPHPARVALAVLAWLVLSLPAGTASGASKNLLTNPGFEDDLAGHPWMPAGWDTSVSGLPTTFFGRDTFLARSGRFAVNVANISTVLPMAHNWSQSLLIPKEAWGKDLVLSVWTRSNGVEGRAYVLLQAYRDTLSKMALTWKVPREEARARLRINRVDDPLVDFGWKRVFFTDPQTEWVKRDLRVYCPPGANVVFVRAGVLGTGQILIDDASLTIENPLPAPPLKNNANLLLDPGFEGDWGSWEISLPPYAGLNIERDTQEARSGTNSVAFEYRAEPGAGAAPLITRVGICQVVSNRNFGGKRVRLSAWGKTDSLNGVAYLKLFAHGKYGTVQGIASEQFSGDTPWTLTTQELDLPPETYQVWAWCQYDAPVTGRVHFDDVSLEVIGKATAPPKVSRPKPQKNAKASAND